MKHKIVFVALLALVVTLFASTIAEAQGPKPGAPRAPSANAGTAFLYQGRLVNGGVPVTDTCNFIFRMYDAQSGGNQIGPGWVTNTIVASGVFTASLDFGAGAHNGDARWLDMQVRCPANTGSYTPLVPRQQLTPAPIALSLPGLYTQQTASTPNLIGGYSGNVISPTVVGGTISGGGSASYPNVIDTGANFSTISGGLNNNAKSYYTVIGGGSNNIAGGYGSTIGGGGTDGIAPKANQAFGIASTIGGGMGNVITTTASYATIPGGLQAEAFHYGETAYASGQFSTPGDAQTSMFVMRNTGTGAATTELFLDGSSQRLTLAEGRTVTFDILVVGHGAFGAAAGYQFRGVIKKYGGTTSIVGTVSKTVIAEDDSTWDANVTADNANSSLKITAVGSGLATSYWVASVRTVEYGY